jgi:hypothetical protein
MMEKYFKGAILLTFNNEPINSEQDLVKALNNAHKMRLVTAHCEFAIINYNALHHTEVSLMLYYDQLNVISKYL